MVSSNCKLIHVPLNDDDKYQQSILHEGEFDLVIVDGRRRVECVKSCLSNLNDHSCLILDDSERAQYSLAKDHLFKNGFKELAFYGVAPGLPYKKCTSIFYKASNCLNI